MEIFISIASGAMFIIAGTVTTIAVFRDFKTDKKESCEDIIND